MDLPPDVEKALPGIAGSLTALAFLRENWTRLIVMGVAGSICAQFTAPLLERAMGPRLAGYFTGLFGMAVIAAVFKLLAAIDVAAIGGEITATASALIKRWRRR